MPKNIGILFVASEAEPFIRTGSLGDLAGTLPKLIKTSGCDIRVMLPGYGSINNRRFQIHSLLRMKDIEVPIGSGMETANIKSSYLNSESQKVLVYFISNERYFNREGLYYHPETKKYFLDNDERFIFFCRGVLETLKRLQWQPDIIHCNDWQSGLIPAYLKTLYKNDPFFKNVKTVFTVYSLASYATFPKGSFLKAGLPEELLSDNGNGAGKLSFLKAGLTFADIVTTIGTKAEKGIRPAPDDELGRVLQSRHMTAVSMHNALSGHSGDRAMSDRFIEVYRDLAKNP